MSIEMETANSFIPIIANDSVFGKVVFEGNLRTERIYLGSYEIYRRYSTNGNIVQEELQTLHLQDDQQRVCMVESPTIENGTTITSVNPRFRYQLGNHLGSVAMETDENAQIITYEEYHPYGTTAYRARSAQTEVSAKRYRYTGMERDEETGLSYHTARYYLSWLGRWISTDPIGVFDDANLFKYGANSPTTWLDTNGKHITNNSQGKIGNKDGFIENQGAEGRYIFTKRGGWLDRAHVLDHVKFAVNLMAGIQNGDPATIKIEGKFEREIKLTYADDWKTAPKDQQEERVIAILTELDVDFELWQKDQLTDGGFARSEIASEDLTSNRVGIEIGLRLLRKGQNAGLNTGLQYVEFLKQNGALQLFQ